MFICVFNLTRNRNITSDTCMSQLIKSYEQLTDAEKEKIELEKEVADLKRKTYGTASTKEDIARRFFAELAESSEGIEDANKELQDKIKASKKADEKLKNAKQNFLRTLTQMRFPFKLGEKVIEKRENDIIFNFEEEIKREVLEKIAEFLGLESLKNESVIIGSSDITAKNFLDASKAMEAVMSHVENKIRKNASTHLEIDKYVTELRNRDDKIQKMLYVLFETDKALSKKELEMGSKLEKGALRGVLYVVLKRDPYLRKVGSSKYELTEIGKRVVSEYVRKYGSPLEKDEEHKSSLSNFQNTVTRDE